MSITFSKFGNYGRLGNQLFQYASMLGIAKANNTDVVLPRCDFAEYLETPPTIGAHTQSHVSVNEKHYHFDESLFSLPHTDCDITGWLQSEKYWQHCKEHVREMLKFKHSIWHMKYKFANEGKQTIAISIRRGDYVDNPNYELLNADYYYLALLEHFPDWRDCNILIFSDDTPYCRVHFQCLPNVHFVEGLNPMDQLILGSLCDNFIIANSTFSWWMAYLGEKEHGKVIRPNYLFAGKLLAENDWSDFYPDRWTVFDHKGHRLNMPDVTFLIPVSIDSSDRRVNCDTITENIATYIKAHVVIGDPQQAWGNGTNKSKFHRTKWLNEATSASWTPIIINYDCDILTPPLQIYLAVEMLRNNEADMVYPYDGRFARCPRTWIPVMQKYNDCGMFKDTLFVGCRPTDGASVGGVVAYRKDKFIESGGENEKMISYAPEDQERFYRWNKLGYRVARVKGCCYHLDHVITTNSSTMHPDYQANEAEFNYVKSLSESGLKDYVKTWGYFQNAATAHP